MHIAFNGWFWDRPDTGSGQYLRKLLHHLRKIDAQLDMTLILPPHNNQPDDLPPNVNVLSTGQRQHVGRLGKVLFEQRTFPRMAEQAQADIAHVPYWAPPLACGMPLITSVLDVIPLLYPVYSHGIANRLYTALVSAGTRGAGHILTISHTSKLDIEQQLNIDPDRISVTYLAPDERFHPIIGAERDEAVRQKYNLPDQFVLYLGGFDARKNVNELMLAYTYVGEAEGENIPLVLAGREPEWGSPLFPDLREYARRLNIEDYVRWIGYVDEADKPSLYRLADVFVYPSEYEGFGLPPLEAMASGTPVVTLDQVIFDEILEDGAYLAESSRAMAGAIIALILQKPFRETMINQGLAQATRYTWRKTARETRAAYDALLRRAADQV